MSSSLRFTTFFINAFVICISWTSSFSLNGWFTLPVIFSLLTALIFAFEFLIKSYKSKKYIFIFSKIDFPLILVFFLLLVNVLFLNNDKSLNYLLSYFYVYLFSYFLLKFIIHNHIDINQILKINFLGCLLVVIFVIAEFILKFVFNIDVQDFIPRTFITKAIYSDLLLPRSSGFSEEPTYLAWYLNTCGLLSIWWLNQNKKVKKTYKYIFISFFCIAYIFTFSAAGLGLLMISYFLLNISSLKKGYKKILFLTCIILFIYVIIVYLNLEFIFEPILNKLFLKQDRDGDRLPMWIEAFNNNNNFLFGKGLGYYSSLKQESPVNYFLFVFIEAGIFPIILLFYFYSSIYFQYLFRKKDLILKVAYLAGVGHLFTQSLYFHPCLWFLIIILTKNNFSITNERISNYSMGNKQIK